MLDCRFHFKNDLSQLLIYSMEVNIYIGFWTLEMKCTQYGICGKVAFKNARAMVFFESRAGRPKVLGRVLPQKARRG